jgi:hypothetical protein
MANILYRGATPSAANASTGGVSRPLTNDEIDKNFYALNTSKIESESDTLATVTARGSSTSTNLTFNGTNNYIKVLTGVDANHLYLNGANNFNASAFDVRINGGTTTSGNGIGGAVTIGAGQSNGNAAGGALSLYGGMGGTDREGGTVLIRGGNYGPSSGASASAGRGGDVTIQGGYGGASGNNFTGGARGGHVYIKPGVGGVATPASTYIYAPTTGVNNVNSGSGSEVIAAEFNYSTIKLRTGTISFGSQFTGQVEFTTETTFAGTSNAVSSKLWIGTGESYAANSNYIVIKPGVTTLGGANSKGASVTIVGGRAATGTSAFVKTGGDVYIDGGYGMMWSGYDVGYGGTVNIGTSANGVWTAGEQAGTGFINIGNSGYGDPLGGMGQYIPPSRTTFAGHVDVGYLSRLTIFGDLIMGYGGNVFIGSDQGTGGFINYDANDEVSFGYGALFDGAVVNYKVKVGDAYATRIVSGLSTGLNGCTFKFQRANSKVYNSTISWVDDLSITNTGDIKVRSNIYAGGDIYAYYTSDETLKTNIVKIDSALAKVNSLEGITFNWNEVAEEKLQKDVNVREAGVIAQQVQAVLPEVVKTREDGTLAVKYEQMVPLLIEAIKELTSQVKDLQNQLMNK